MSLTNILGERTTFTEKAIGSIGFSRYSLPDGLLVLKLGNQVYEGRMEDGTYHVENAFRIGEEK